MPPEQTAGIVAVATWFVTYLLLGGRFTARYPFMPFTWLSILRTVLAGIVALVVGIVFLGIAVRPS